MSDPAFHPLRILESRTESPELTHLTLGDASIAYLQTHTTPGQYVQLEAPEQRPGFFAIACQPGNDVIELLLKRGTPVSDHIIALKADDTVSASEPMGKGYPMDKLRGHDVVLAGVGSAMAPLRAAVQFILRERDTYGAIDFYYGARQSDWVPYSAEVNSWAERGIAFHPTWSVHNPDGSVNGERIQDRILRLRPKLTPRAAALICGMKSMVSEVTAAFEAVGLPPDRVFQNF